MSDSEEVPPDWYVRLLEAQNRELRDQVEKLHGFITFLLIIVVFSVMNAMGNYWR
jgi:hypothetical protein